MVAEEVSWLVDHKTYNISTGALHKPYAINIVCLALAMYLLNHSIPIIEIMSDIDR